MTSTFHQRLRASRKRRQLTIEEVANKLGVAKSTYAGYESNYREPSLTIVRSIAIILQTSIDYLLGITPKSMPISTEINLRAFLQNSLIHWEGKPLSNEELHRIIRFIEEMRANG